MPPPLPLPGAAIIKRAVRAPSANERTRIDFDQSMIPPEELVVTVTNSRFRPFDHTVAATVPVAGLALLHAGAVANASAAVLPEGGFAGAVVVARGRWLRTESVAGTIRQI